MIFMAVLNLIHCLQLIYNHFSYTRHSPMNPQPQHQPQPQLQPQQQPQSQSQPQPSTSPTITPTITPTTTPTTTHPHPQKPTPKTKLNNISNRVFNIILQKKQITDTALMRELFNQFPKMKQDTLKRRKYDALNILINSDIVVVEKLRNQGEFLYWLRSDVPNSVGDLEEVRRRYDDAYGRVMHKKEILERARLAERNYARLIRLNQIRFNNPQQTIMMPFIGINRKYLSHTIKQDSKTEQIQLRFPANTTYHVNLLNTGEFFLF